MFDLLMFDARTAGLRLPPPFGLKLASVVGCVASRFCAPRGDSAFSSEWRPTVTAIRWWRILAVALELPLALCQRRLTRRQLILLPDKHLARPVVVVLFSQEQLLIDTGIAIS